MKSEILVRQEIERVEKQIDKIEDSHRGTGVDPRPRLALETARLETLRWVIVDAR